MMKKRARMRLKVKLCSKKIKLKKRKRKRKMEVLLKIQTKGRIKTLMQKIAPKENLMKIMMRS